jgi:hypothetical protein
MILLAQHPAVTSPAEASAEVFLHIGSPTSLGLPAAIAGDTLRISLRLRPRTRPTIRRPLLIVMSFGFVAVIIRTTSITSP